MRTILRAACIAACVSAPAAALETSPHPIARPGTDAAQQIATVRPSARPFATVEPQTPFRMPHQVARAEQLMKSALRVSSARLAELVDLSPRPLARPVVSTKSIAPPSRTLIVSRSPFPMKRPTNVVRPRAEAQVVRAAAVAPRQATPLSRRGAVCGDRSIRGEALSPIAGRLRGCGIAEPVRVTEIDGVRLSQAAVMNCDTATSIKRWINEGVRPAVGRTGGGLSALGVVGHYVCRTRNHKPGAKISEHGKGNAIDIAALMLKDGSAITVLHGWCHRTQGPILKDVHRAACGPFGTVLGPNADQYHQDHFHFDVARHRGGPYCR